MATPRSFETPIQVNGTPGSPNAEIPGIPYETIILKADPTTQYVAAGPINWFQNVPRSLNWTFDTVTAQFGDDVYERMALYPAVTAAIQVLKTGIMDAGINFTSAQPIRDQEGYDDASVYVDFCAHVMDDLDMSFHQVLWNLLDATMFGNKVAEKTFRTDTTYSGKTQIVLDKLAVKPRESVSFVVDAYKNVLGLLGLIPGQGQPVQVGLIITDLSKQPNLISRNKFVVYAFRPLDSDPRGTSILRSAFDAWNQSIQMSAEFLKYLSQFASPSLIGLTAPDAQLSPLTDATGQLILDNNGQPQVTSPETLMASALQQFRNGSVLVFPSGSVVQPLHMAGDGQQFLQAFDRFDRQITKAILSTTLATEEGQHQARAAASVHQDSLDTIIRQEKRTVADMIRRDILQPLIYYNFGPDKAKLYTPRVSLGSIEQEDQSSRIMALAQGFSTNFIGPSQLPPIYRELGLPERDPADLAAITQTRLNVREQANLVNAPEGRDATGTTTASSAPAETTTIPTPTHTPAPPTTP